MSYWAVVQCEAQREPIARLLLIRLGFPTYMPRIREKQRIKPLFAGYVFVRIHDRWYAILSTAHVIRILMAGNKPAELKDEIIDGIRKREIDGFVKLPKQRAFKPGQQVSIVAGSFAGQIGLYAGMSGKERERVLLDLLGQRVPVVLPGKDIAPLDVVVRSRPAC